jgi:hypothetical protein
VTQSTAAVPQGKHQVRMEFTYDGGGIAKGGKVALFIDGKKTGEGRVEQTVPGIFSADETCDIGLDYRSPVTKDYGKKAHFNGEVNWVEFDIGAAANDADHQISPEERFRVAMAIQ